MTEPRGDFDIHLTVYAYQTTDLAVFAERNGVKYTRIMLDEGRTGDQPMITATGHGTLAEMMELADGWKARLAGFGVGSGNIRRVKIEAAPWNDGVPADAAEAANEPRGRYFEHHVKLLLPDASASRLVDLAELAEQHGARLSRNARRQRPDGTREWFVTQRCRGVGRAEAHSTLEELLAVLGGYEILAVEEEYVVHDSAEYLDVGWLLPERELDGRLPGTADHWRENLPETYRSLAGEPGVTQGMAFDPAMKQHTNAYRPGEPAFADQPAGERWQAARLAAMRHVLGVLTGSEQGGQLVLRGSACMAAWFGDAARNPGDLDFVVLPDALGPDDPQALALRAGLIAAIRAHPGAGVDGTDAVVEDIWTYERAEGRRIVLGFRVPGLPDGSVQVDLVFREPLPLAPAPLAIPGIAAPVLAATPELSLAWKLMWLATDQYPQGKDLYDAVLLAGLTPVSLALVRDLIRPELGPRADGFGVESVLAWDVDWPNFQAEYPSISEGTARTMKRRLARALAANSPGWE
ncbi:nucleotidyl transferase AbiEii/AbiGii toxin family protein [Longispora albida]|uniref:nucleotidyl transferase AbiEii/AbiGii toxin family protein n=1 Tax=Longispora albida TaxID=203523 RepID=UPI0003704E06|nr:nucleotidyl transferase AbiEii/AbiGii toxin family protein [Longispora albida]